VEEKIYPEGHFVGLYMAGFTLVVSVIGILLSIYFGWIYLIGVWPGLGVAIGLAVGSAVESKYKKEGRIRPMNEKEKSKQKKAIVWALAAGVLMVLILIGVFLLGS